MTIREQTCCFTGHRRLPEVGRGMIESKAALIIRDLYSKGVRFFRVGGALGFDTVAAQLLFKLRTSELTDIKISLLYPFDGFTASWTDKQNALYAELLPQYDEVHCISKQNDSAAYLARNRALADGSAYCVAYCGTPTGGAVLRIRCDMPWSKAFKSSIYIHRNLLIEQLLI